MKKSILVVCDVKTWGGWERAQMIKKYLSDEYDIDLMDQEEFKNYEALVSNFISKKDIDDYFTNNNIWQTKQHAYLPHMLKFLKGNPHKKRYDLIYLMFHTLLAWQEVNRMMVDGHNFISVVTGAPVVKEVFYSNNNGPKGLPYFLELANKSKGVLCNNLISLRELKSIYKGPTGYIPRGVDPDLFQPIRPYNNGIEFTVGFVGKKDSNKGLNSIIKPACKKINVKLEFNERNYTDALSKEEMCHFYNRIHVLAVASKTDGTPNPALEAAACGRPIVSVPVGNMPEFIKNGYNGFLLKMRHVDVMAAKLEELRDNMQLGEQMGKNARQTVLDGWTWEHSMEYERKALRHIFKEMEK